MESIKETACRVPVLVVLVRAGLSGSKHHAKDMAASIAFFSFLSLFPLVLGGVALASSVLESQQLRSRIMQGVNEFFPVGADFVTENIESLVRLRGAAGLASILILLWPARTMVGTISRGINLALHMDREFSFFLSPLRNFALVVGITLLTFSTTALSPIADVLSELDPGVLNPELEKLVDVVGGHFAVTSSQWLFYLMGVS